jgi:hypothetical protein
MGKYEVSIRDDDDVYQDVVEMTKAQADALRKEGETAVASGRSSAVGFRVDPLIVFSLDGWRAAYGDMLVIEDEDGEDEAV